MQSPTTTQIYWLTCADGLETLLADEVSAWGAVVEHVQQGRVEVRTTQAVAYRICLWSRLVSRVLRPLFSEAIEQAEHRRERDVAEELYEAAVNFDWTLIFSPLASMAVRLYAERDIVVNTQFATLKVKDGIVDAFKMLCGNRPSINPKEPDITISVYAGKDDHVFCLDMSGDSLYMRGYRMAMTEAPLKENLAAAVLHATGIAQQLASGTLPYKVWLDPMCGSGTLLTEAMMMYVDAAPRMKHRFGFIEWKSHDHDVWAQLLNEAKARLQVGLSKPMPTVYGFDADMHAVQASKTNWAAAGLADPCIPTFFENRVLGDWDNLTHYPKGLSGSDVWLITNPPYGERIGEKISNKALYQGINLALRRYFVGARVSVFAQAVEIADVLSLHEPTTHRFMNGKLPIYIRSGNVLAPKGEPLLSRWQATDFSLEEAQDFANRLSKNMHNVIKQAQKQRIDCVRIYDADLPDYNLAIDLYGDYVHVQEYAPPKEIEAEKAKKRLSNALHAIRQVLGVNREDVFIKVRSRQQGNKQYEKTHTKTKRHIVMEGDCYFLVNLTDYIDTGLFLDHRPLRQQVGAIARGKNVLNLFSYTCSVGVHAAMGGALSTTNVDLSNTYLDWGKENYALNGLWVDDGIQHRFIASDVFEWLKQCEYTFDVIFLDPPTFSNSKKFFGTFDIQRDQSALINLVMDCLNPDGVLYFSNNNRKFMLDPRLEEWFEVSDISAQSIDFDFKRNANIHKAWRIKHRSL